MGTNIPLEQRSPLLVQRFRPYSVTPEGGKDGQVRMSSIGAYVRWVDYERLENALKHLLSHWDEEQQRFELCGTAVAEARKAVDEHMDWQHVFDRKDPVADTCTCYGYEGDSETCALHARCRGCGQRIDPTTCGCGDPMLNHSPWRGHPPIPMGCDCYRDKGEVR